MQNTIFADCVVSSATGTEGVFRRICNAGNYGNVNYTLGYNTYYYSAVREDSLIMILVMRMDETIREQLLR